MLQQYLSFNFFLLIFIIQVSLGKIISRTICEQEEFGFSFSGVIVQHQTVMDYPFQSHARITRCVNGKERPVDAFLPLPATVDIPWGTKFCTGHKNEKSVCYILARRKLTSNRILSVYPPNEWVGGIFMCPSHLSDDGLQCYNKDAIPLWPLVSPKFMHFENIQVSSTISRIPLLVSIDPQNSTNSLFAPRVPIPENWANHIHVNEGYSSVADDRDKMRMAWDVTLNIVKSMTDFVQGAILPPVTDLIFDLGDKNQRRPVRKIPDRFSFEENPAKFSVEPSVNYLDLPGLKGDDYTRASRPRGGNPKSMDVRINSESREESKITPGVIIRSFLQLPSFMVNKVLSSVYASQTHTDSVSNVEKPMFLHQPLQDNPNSFLDEITQ